MNDSELRNMNMNSELIVKIGNKRTGNLEKLAKKFCLEQLDEFDSFAYVQVKTLADIWRKRKRLRKRKKMRRKSKQ